MGRARSSLRNVAAVLREPQQMLEQKRRLELEDLIKSLTNEIGDFDASEVTYDNSTSGLDAVSVQGAIDEVSLRQQITTVTASTHTVAPGDYLHSIIHVTTAGGCTVTLPAGFDDFQRVSIKRASGAGKVIVLTPGSEEIDGEDSAELDAVQDSITLYETGGNYFSLDAAMSKALLTVFGEQRTAEYTPLIARDPSSGLRTTLRDNLTETNGGTVTHSGAEFLLSTSTTTSSVASIATYERGKYLPALEAMASIAVRRPTAPTGNIDSRWGYFDDDDGFIFGEDATGLYIQHRHASTTESKVYQSSWNGDDTLDGNGPSGETLDLTNVNIYRTRFVAYGAGPVKFEVIGTGSNGREYRAVVHYLAPLSGEPVLSQWKLPIVGEVENGATATDYDMYVLGRGFGVFGRYTPDRRTIPETRSNVSIAATTTEPLITLRKKTDSASKGIGVRLYDASITSDKQGVLKIYANATLTGDSFGALSEVAADQTAVESDTSATAISGGTLIEAAEVPSSSGGGNAAINLQELALDFPDDVEFTLAFENLEGIAATVSGTFTVLEES